MTRFFNAQLRFHTATVLALATSVVLIANVAPAAEATTAKADPAARQQAVNRAIDYFKQTQADDGSFSASSGPGLTAMVATALLKSGLTAKDPMVARALKYVEDHIHDDGGIYADGSRYKNYETCLAIVCFQEANHDGQYNKLLAGAEKFVKKEQWDEGENVEVSDMRYGGAGYGSSSRPDLSNTSFLVDALHAVGDGADDPALQKALIFVSRCQNLESDKNTSPFAAKVNDGGFYYTVAAGGSSPAGKTEDDGLRSYGSMTYAGLKSMIYAGVTPDDPRVKAANKWITEHYTLDENPGMGQNGLYYYYHTFAKALATIGDAQLTDSAGKTHDWRAELTAKLLAEQGKDGSWVNTAPRWLEGDPNLVTAYSLMALSYCQPKVDLSPALDKLDPQVTPEVARPKR